MMGNAYMGLVLDRELGGRRLLGGEGLLTQFQPVIVTK